MSADNFEKFKDSYLLEKHRVQSFKDWPFDAKASCNVEKMSEAGFFWCGSELEKDTVTCFLCGKTLDGWEANDDPWKEHVKHAPQCMFVKLGKRESELAVSDFLIIFRELIKNHMRKTLERNIKDLKLKSGNMLEEFTSKNK